MRVGLYTKNFLKILHMFCLIYNSVGLEKCVIFSLQMSKFKCMDECVTRMKLDECLTMHAIKVSTIRHVAHKQDWYSLIRSKIICRQKSSGVQNDFNHEFRMSAELAMVNLIHKIGRRRHPTKLTVVDILQNCLSSTSCNYASMHLMLN